MRKFLGIDWRWTLVVEAVVFVLLVAGWITTGALFGIVTFGNLVIIELVAWFLRLLWLSPLLFVFIGRRLLGMVVVVFFVIVIGFTLLQIAPGDPLSQVALEFQDPAELERVRDNFGFNKPPLEQFFLYIRNIVLYGDFGFSFNNRAPVMTLVQQRAANTLLISVSALVLSWGLSIPFGIIAARKQYKWQDQTLSFLSFAGLAIPNFFLAFLLLYLIGQLKLPSGDTILPLGGMQSNNFSSLTPFQQVLDVAQHMILPVFVLAVRQLASLVRIMRANMLDVMHQQYITTARAKGLSENTVVYKHALRNAINPMITLLGFQIGTIMGGAALVENVIQWPGLGQLILQAIITQDMYLVIGSLLYGSILLVVGNLIADILLALTDPRVKIS